MNDPRDLVGALLESASDAVAVLDHDGTVLAASHPVRALRESEALLPKLLESLSQTRAEALATARTIERTVGPFPDLPECRCRVVPFASGGRRGVVVTLVGMEALRPDPGGIEERLRESEERFRLLAEGSQDVLFRYRVRPTPGFEYVSPAVLRVTGFTPEECYAMPFLALAQVHPDDRPALQEVLRTRSTKAVTFRWYRKDGTLVWAEQRMTPILDGAGKLVAFQGIARDVSERVQAEQALRDAHRRKDEFLATLSHELRNPLAPLLNSLYVIDRSPPGSEAWRRAQAVVGRQARHLVRLVDDLLDVTRISRGKITLHQAPQDLAAVVERTVEDRRPALEARGLALDVRLSGPLWVMGDEVRLAQIVSNLLNNAGKFTPDGGRVEVSLEAGEGAVLRVRDSGIGIPPEMLGKVFEPFVQAPGPSAPGAGGLGLGLALVKGFVELHGGKVKARSQGPGRGAEFEVRLPLASAPQSEMAASPEGSPHRKVLIIEDNVDAAASLGDFLRLEKHEVRIAHDGPTGLARAREFSPEVVLCDIGLPGMDGYAVARALRAEPSLRSSRIVALTGYALPEDRRRAAEAGFDAHLSKPASIDALERVLR